MLKVLLENANKNFFDLIFLRLFKKLSYSLKVPKLVTCNTFPHLVGYILLLIRTNSSSSTTESNLG